MVSGSPALCCLFKGLPCGTQEDFLVISLTLAVSNLCCPADVLLGEGGLVSTPKVLAAFPCPAACLSPWGCEELQPAPLAALWVPQSPFHHSAGTWPDTASPLALLVCVEEVRASGSSLGCSLLAGWPRDAKLWDTIRQGRLPSLSISWMLADVELMVRQVPGDEAPDLAKAALAVHSWPSPEERRAFLLKLPVLRG